MESNLFFPMIYMGLPGGSVVKNLPVNAGDMGSIPGLGKFHGQGSLAGKSPYGLKRVGHNLATKQLHTYP